MDTLVDLKDDPVNATEPRPEPQPEHETDPASPVTGPEAEPATPAAARFRLGLLVIMLAALLVASGSLIWLAAHRTGSESDISSDREQVMSLSEQFMLRMGTYGPDLLDEQGQMPDYRSGVKELITPKFATSFDTQVGAAEQLVKQTGVSRKADVYATGVSSIDSDSADVLVAGAFTDSYKDQPGEPLAVRMQVSLVKIDGKWVVDNFSPLTAPDTGASQ